MERQRASTRRPFVFARPSAQPGFTGLISAQNLRRQEIPRIFIVGEGKGFSFSHYSTSGPQEDFPSKDDVHHALCGDAKRVAAVLQQALVIAQVSSVVAKLRWRDNYVSAEKEYFNRARHAISGRDSCSDHHRHGWRQSKLGTHSRCATDAGNSGGSDEYAPAGKRHCQRQHHWNADGERKPHRHSQCKCHDRESFQQSVVCERRRQWKKSI